MKTKQQRIVLGIEYLGTHYHGWQRQANVNSTQATLEKALSEVAAHPVSTICAGRTDRGVHATSQYVHFDCVNQRPLKAWLRGVNTLLPDDISVFHAQEVDSVFDARRSASSRTYIYLINNAKLPSALLDKQCTWINQSLEYQKMHLSAQVLLGEQNFSAFRSAHCQSHSVHRFMTQISVKRYGDLVVIEITANAFLHHMVRNIVGSLLEVGKGSKPVDWIEELLVGEDRTKAGITAPPNGLHLIGVQYPEKYRITDAKRYPLLLSTQFRV